MKVGVPTETKMDEYRVALTPAGARELVEHGHEVCVQAGAGVGSTVSDEEFSRQGARLPPDAQSVFDESDLPERPEPGHRQSAGHPGRPPCRHDWPPAVLERRESTRARHRRQ